MGHWNHGTLQRTYSGYQTLEHWLWPERLSVLWNCLGNRKPASQMYGGGAKIVLMEDSPTDIVNRNLLGGGNRVQEAQTGFQWFWLVDCTCRSWITSLAPRLRLVCLRRWSYTSFELWRFQKDASHFWIAKNKKMFLEFCSNCSGLEINWLEQDGKDCKFSFRRLFFLDLLWKSVFNVCC